MSWLIALDPGQTTGWFSLLLDPGRTGLQGASFNHAELPWDGALDKLQRLLAGGAIRVVVCETFVISTRTATAGNAAKIPIGIALAAEWLCSRTDPPVEFVSYKAPESKAFATDAKLKALGWHPKPVGGGHARDATRQAVLWLARTGRLEMPE